MRILIFLLVVIGAATSSWADAIVLKDGTRIEGSIKRVGDAWHITRADGKVVTVPVSNVRTIELGGGGGAGTAASGNGGADEGAGPVDAGLASLRRSVGALADIDQIIERYERFIANAKDAAVAAEAKKDLATWRDRREKGYVKQGPNWVTLEQAEQLRGKSLATAEQAREQLRMNRLPEAEALIAKALDEDPSNPAALYLRGVMLYRQDKLVDARKAFEAVEDAEPQHAPTLNNLAVILARQNQHGGALVYYDQAMQAQPVNKFILDNVAEQLGTMPEEHRKGKAVERVIRRFNEQDLLLQQQLSPRGWFRWGSTWVDQKQLDELKVAEKEIMDRIATMEGEFEQNKQRISDIENRIRSNEAQMRDMEARRMGFRDKDGRVHLYPLPQAYYDLKRENDNLRDEQQRLRLRFDQLREQARRTRQQLPTPKFTGVQHVVGPEGAPLLAPPPVPAAAPAAAPATTES